MQKQTKKLLRTVASSTTVCAFADVAPTQDRHPRVLIHTQQLLWNVEVERSHDIATKDTWSLWRGAEAHSGRLCAAPGLLDPVVYHKMMLLQSHIV